MTFSAVLMLLLTALRCQQVGSVKCRKVHQTAVSDVVRGHCPINLTSHPPTAIETSSGYYEMIRVHVWINSTDFHQIEMEGHYKDVFRPYNNCKIESHSRPIRCCKNSTNSHLWKLELNFKAYSRKSVSVSYSSKSINCSVRYVVPGPQPNFRLSVNKSSKTISVHVDSGDPVNIRWCYEDSYGDCSNGHSLTKNRSAVITIPYLLPCVCVEVYYTYRDASRRRKCPFRNESLIDNREILQTSEVTVFESYLLWTPQCPECRKQVSAALCWKMHNNVCIPIPNSTLEKNNEPALQIKTSTVDKHPQICVQFFIQDSHSIYCLFDKPSWETHITPARQSVLVHITSTVSATFSAQLCLLTEAGCVPRGQIHSETMATNHQSVRINVPIQDITERSCVQVWQSDPALSGRRILCPDYTHNRWGVYAIGVLLLVLICMLLGSFIHRATKSGKAGWLTIQRPVLLVCSSDQSAHVSAVCALASILHEELDAPVHTALWSQSSQTQAQNGASVADLGPLPWLYGQWEAVREAQGKILIMWSPEAKRTYQRWRGSRVDMDNSWRTDKIRAPVHDYLKVTGSRVEKNNNEKCIESRRVNCFEDEDSQKEPSTVIKPMFVAALASLEAALLQGKGKDVAIVYFQGLCHSRDIPHAFKGVPRFCLPQEFSGLIQELAEGREGTKSGKFRWHCWPRLLSKVLSACLARQLTQRLQTVLPQTRAQRVSSAIKTSSDQTKSRWKPPLVGSPNSKQEQEPVHR
ncbi:interleukin-17 receptor E-like [Xiphophorus maculatus]|uniref:Interleukin-17 receptor E-like n=1 Tax=Xiphophorus maculatus TaxID=8083 RepID=A0A3B5RF23_XIPMA|nr:interleukin-17 receptor E-like [Xiphophorus maculatus]